MDNLTQQVERVARAFYDAEEDAFLWESEPEILKEEFRQYAREAIALLERRGEQLLDAA